MAKITLYSLSDYNCGDLIAHTFDLDDFDSKDEYREAIAEWLEQLTTKKNDGLAREEWIVCDHEDIPDRLVGEYDLDSDYWEYKTILGATHLPAEAIEVWLNYGYILDQDEMEDSYRGKWETDEDFVQEMLEDCGYIPENMPAYIHIDWERTARDVMIDYFEENGHYFRVN